MMTEFRMNHLYHSASHCTSRTLYVDECRGDLSLCANKIECTQTKLQVTESSWCDCVITSAGVHAGQILHLSGHTNTYFTDSRETWEISLHA